MAQVPPPPQAEGRKIFCALSVESKVEPAVVTMGFSLSPFTTILTGPDCTSFDWATRRIRTNNRITTVKAMIEVTMIGDISILLKFQVQIYNPSVESTPDLGGVLRDS